jgi:hypothetical protein
MFQRRDAIARGMGDAVILIGLFHSVMTRTFILAFTAFNGLGFLHFLILNF